METPAYAQNVEDFSSEGLSSEQALALKETHGPNKLPEAEQETAFRRLLRQFQDPMIYVLIGAAIITAFLGQVIDTIVIAAVVIINALVGFIQEGKAADALDSIRDMLAPHTTVCRDGQWQDIEAEELVPGDVVRINPGDKVPADLRLIETTNLSIEESVLTGESVSSEKDTHTVEEGADLGDRSSMAFSGTSVAAGSGQGVVVATGQHTEIGRITTMLDDVQKVETPLTKSMATFSSWIAIVAVVLAFIMAAVAYFVHNFSIADVLISSIGFAVAAIPEGLPAVMAITLALGVQKMAGRNAITRQLNSVETLGSVTTICSDKTGTLTKNEMTVRVLVTPEGEYEVTGTGYSPEGSITGEATEDVRILTEVAAYANEAEVVEKDGSWQLIGEPTDGGIRTLALKAGIHPEHPRIDAVPFDSEYKYMATLDDMPSGRVIHVKGAPDRLLERCDMSAQDRTKWEQLIDELGSRGMRVLAAASADGQGKDEINVDDIDAGRLTFRGLYGIIDPPREEVIDAVKTVQDAGIRIRMITGDHASTATAIAQDIGLANTRAITGRELEEASDEQLRDIVRDYDVYARTSPEHKLRLVQALQANGEVTSMTGDGVNDAPSLKQADVGVAMGIKGTEATKDAADIVLADDNFATIADAVKMGRNIFDNLRKAIVFMLPTNGAQGLVVFVAMLIGMTLPITPLQVLWVNLITAVTLSLALSFEPAEPDIMDRPPRDPRAGLLSREAVIRIIYVSLLIGASTIGVFSWLYTQGVDLEVARTVAVNTLVVAQVFYLFTARFMRVSALRKELFTTNPVSWLCVVIMVILQLAFVYLPFMHTAFGTTSVNLTSWIVPIVVGIAVFVVVEIEKAIRRAI